MSGSFNSAQTTPFARTLTQFTEGKFKILDDLKGQQLPCSVVAVQNAIVTVKVEVQSNITFPQITVPQAISRYARPPTQVGDKGFLTAADVYLGGVTGLGGGVANYAKEESNLTTLVFVPLSSTDTGKFPVIDPNAYHITGPNGAVIQDDSNASNVTLTPTSITLTQGSASVTITGGQILISGTLIINGTPFLAHQHTGVQTGGGNTGGVV
jgi:hypothetical protein